MTLKLLYGDGIFFADPVQPVVIDDADKIVAAGPVGLLLYLDCHDGSATPTGCRLYDPFEGRVHTLDPDAFEILGELTEGRPANYPDRRLHTGFATRDASILERISFEARNVVNKPIGFAFLMLWLIVIWTLLLSLKIAPEKWTTRSGTFWLAKTVGKLVYALFLMAVLAYIGLIIPFSCFFLLTAVVASGTLCLLVKLQLRRWQKQARASASASA
ncbi:hypothetical protein [Bauldia sp.]|uniref:hypothetical protein n=1 Tax=Bauldia sp. TaxID=2575872 RepID=UPI003BA9A459